METAGKPTSFWSDIGAWGQHSGFDRSVFRHSYSDDKEDQMKRWDGNDYKWVVAMRIMHSVKTVLVTYVLRGSTRFYWEALIIERWRSNDEKEESPCTSLRE